MLLSMKRKKNRLTIFKNLYNSYILLNTFAIKLERVLDPSNGSLIYSKIFGIVTDWSYVTHERVFEKDKIREPRKRWWVSSEADFILGPTLGASYSRISRNVFKTWSWKVILLKCLVCVMLDSVKTTVSFCRASFNVMFLRFQICDLILAETLVEDLFNEFVVLEYDTSGKFRIQYRKCLNSAAFLD